MLSRANNKFYEQPRHSVGELERAFNDFRNDPIKDLVQGEIKRRAKEAGVTGSLEEQVNAGYYAVLDSTNTGLPKVIALTSEGIRIVLNSSTGEKLVVDTKAESLGGFSMGPDEILSTLCKITGITLGPKNLNLKYFDLKLEKDS